MTDYDPDAILADSDAPPIHKLYAAINIGIRDRGEQWAKCANCGQPYQLVHKGDPYTVFIAGVASAGVIAEEDWTNGTVCSPICFQAFRASLDER